MSNRALKIRGLGISIIIMLLLTCPLSIHAAIDGISGITFDLTVKEDYISTPDGGAILMWGYAPNGGTMQYPGPTLIVDQGVEITVNLTNTLSVPTSIVFPGHNVTSSGGSSGLLAREAAPLAGTVTYTFTPDHPGTYTYYSGTSPELQVEMGLVGAIIVRPTGYNETSNRIAYNQAESAYDREYLYLLTDMDVGMHQMVESGNMGQIDNNAFWPVYWFINGRAFPDTLEGAGAAAPWLPTQPYNSLTIMNVGEKVLMRVIGAGRDLHPFHHHGNNATVIARDGRPLSSTGASIDIPGSVFTITSAPGQTVDAIFEWTGKDMDWDYYGHSVADPIELYESYDQTTIPSELLAGATTVTVNAWANNDVPSTRKFNAVIDSAEMITMIQTAPGAYTIERGLEGTTDQTWPAGTAIVYTDHGKPFPLGLPETLNVTIGGAYSGSPFMGASGSLPPGEGGLNEGGAFVFPWHSHLEKEIINNDVFIGGMLTLLFVLPR